VTADFLNTLWVALALMLVIEGLMPFINPTAFKKTLAQMASMAESQLRIFGLVCMLSGLLLLYWVN
jgi:uncharacterized protein YjeT (DUF2065 family)